MRKKKISIIAFSLTWDYKDSPKWKEVQEAVNDLSEYGFTPQFYEVHTGNDEYRLLITNMRNLTDEQIVSYFNQTMEQE